MPDLTNDTTGGSAFIGAKNGGTYSTQFNSLIPSANRWNINTGNCGGIFLGADGKNVAGKWAHYVITQERAADDTYDLKVYVNGEYYTTGYDKTNNTLIGYDNFVIGSVDVSKANKPIKLGSFNVYSTVKTAEEIAALYNNTKNDYCANVISFADEQVITATTDAETGAVTKITYSKANLINDTMQEVTAKLVFAVYDASTLVDVIIKDVTIPANSKLTNDVILTGDEISNLAAGVTVKTMLWKDLATIKPLADSDTVVIR